MTVFEAWGSEELVELYAELEPGEGLVLTKKKYGNASTLSTPKNIEYMKDADLFDPEERPIWSIRCETWEEAMQFYYDFNGYGTYVPME